MTIVVAILGVIVVLLTLFVVALLRSHAEILRRIAGIESALDDRSTLPGNRPAGHPHGSDVAGAAVDILGETLTGDAVKLNLEHSTSATLLAFLGTGCSACLPLWDSLHSPPIPAPQGARVLVVTKGPEREQTARLIELAPADADLVMSSAAYDDFGVPSTPHFVLVRDGQIAGRGSATSWEQIAAFLEDAAADDRLHAQRALNTEQRAARAERALTEAGIGPGHPSLYPTREPSDPNKTTTQGGVP